MQLAASPSHSPDYLNGALTKIHLSVTTLKAKGEIEKEDCCKEDGTRVKDGEVKKTGTAEAVVKTRGVPLVIVTPLGADFSFSFNLYFVKGKVIGTVGVFVDWELGVHGSFGDKSSQCKADENCKYGDAGVTLKGNAHIDAALHILYSFKGGGPQRSFGGGIEPATVEISGTLSITYNEPKCSDGLGGSLSLNGVDVVLNIPFKTKWFDLTLKRTWHYDGLTLSYTSGSGWHFGHD